MSATVHFRPAGAGITACGRRLVAGSADPARVTCRTCRGSDLVAEVERVEESRRPPAEVEGDDLARAVKEGLRRAGHG